MVSLLVGDGNDALCETARDFAWKTKVSLYAELAIRLFDKRHLRSDTRSLNRLEHRSSFLFALSEILGARLRQNEQSIWRDEWSSELLRTAGKKKRAHRLARKQKLEQKTRQCDVIKFKLTVFYRAESSEYSYHVEEQAVLVKYSSCVSVTWTMQKRGRWECVRVCVCAYAYDRARGEERKNEGWCSRMRRYTANAIAFMAAGWQHDTAWII